MNLIELCFGVWSANELVMRLFNLKKCCFLFYLELIELEDLFYFDESLSKDLSLELGATELESFKIPCKEFLPSVNTSA